MNLGDSKSKRHESKEVICKPASQETRAVRFISSLVIDDNPPGTFSKSNDFGNSDDYIAPTELKIETDPPHVARNIRDTAKDMVASRDGGRIARNSEKAGGRYTTISKPTCTRTEQISVLCNKIGSCL
ncbi:hypothetical protein GLAREA_03989 [Glarea lozoyensis ATCC 20868]|uniref:Uncharacterized protein n=1 Tax=Glarea lozoyensis (strain ATCC 20868 / MF5171) TaxID=1116229 RepID=S3CXF4_GLAL2|nr:uncharacterized protein GLAREA_03989 [Glarea lozoyensis ATCC 20868]EPE31022.1 hypothetical protein GLAREA_03989 [Glarea lozoyensis ATCC 20868]